MTDNRPPIERETTVIHTERSGGSGIIIAIVLLFVIGAVAFFFLGGYFDKPVDKVDVSVNVETPNVELPEIRIDTRPAQPGEPGNQTSN